ncbi:MAG: hypothetical protein IPM23_14195 [Candidatus Melainabacteria bacterium]|nr:hypothetical protein [Candidatus Melainabacteria bacterium]
MRKLAALPLVIILAALPGSFSPGAAVPARVTGWRVSQMTKLNGKTTVYITPAGIKLINDRTGIYVLFLPPYKHAVAVNPGNRKFCSTPIERLQDPYRETNMMFNGGTLRQIELGSSSPTKIFDMPAVQYVATSAFARRQMAAVKAGRMPPRAPKTVEFVVIRNKDCQSRTGTLLTRFYGLPQVDGLPCTFKFRDTRGKDHSILRTLSIKPVTVEKSLFDMPTGYTKAPTNESVFYDGKIENGLEIMFR